jgi:hypothetical protein
LIRDSGLSVGVTLAMMMLLYLVLGAVFDEVAVMVITLPGLGVVPQHLLIDAKRLKC